MRLKGDTKVTIKQLVERLHAEVTVTLIEDREFDGSIVWEGLAENLRNNKTFDRINVYHWRPGSVDKIWIYYKKGNTNGTR